MPIVYAHRSPSGKVYVGWTSHPGRRWSSHVHDAITRGSSRPFHKAIRKYGPKAFTHEVLEVMTTEAGARRAEQLWIKELGAFGPRGYNATDGGEGTLGLVVSDETRAKLSAAHTGRKPWIVGRKHSAETRARMSAAHAGVPHPHSKRVYPVSAETREKIAASKRGRKQTPEHRAAIAAGHARRKASR